MHGIKKNLANVVTSLGIIAGITACIWVHIHPSWILAESLFLVALVTDALDGKVARKFGSTSAGPYLDDIADLINFGIHPALWIWIISGRFWLAALYASCIFGRLLRFTLLKQNTDIFSGLPSPAAALGIFGLVFLSPEIDIFLIGVIFLSFLSISQVRCIHIMKYKKIAALRLPLIIVIALLPVIFGYTENGIGMSHLVIVVVYIFLSLIFLIPRYVAR